MASDVALKELSLLRQYNAKLTGGFIAKVQSEVSRICRKLERQIEVSTGEEHRVSDLTQNAIDDINSTVRYIDELKSRHQLGPYDSDLCDMDIMTRQRTARDLEEQLVRFKRQHQILRTELETTISQLKSFGYTITGQVIAASQTLKSQISVLDKYKETHQ